MVPNVHFLLRQAARERLAAARTLSAESRQRHLAMADVYISRAEQLAQSVPDSPDAKPKQFDRKRSDKPRRAAVAR